MNFTARNIDMGMPCTYDYTKVECFFLNLIYSVLLNIIEGVLGGCGVGGVCVHIKTFFLSQSNSTSK